MYKVDVLCMSGSIIKLHRGFAHFLARAVKIVVVHPNIGCFFHAHAPTAEEHVSVRDVVVAIPEYELCRWVVFEGAVSNDVLTAFDLGEKQE